ncbi:MAG: CoA transferase [Actinomycetota bacterium]|nr:CoA transferase [Actinomycetota bacterium]
MNEGTTGPLAGVRVVELATFIAAPAGTHLLASQGATVIKVEDLTMGDPLRVFGTGKGGMSGWFANLGAGKQSLGLDITSDEGRAVLHRLIESADVFVQAYRPGVAERLGFGAAQMAELNPRLLYVSISGFGEDGPYAQRPAYDAVIQGWSGIAGIQGGDETPTFVKCFLPDKITSLTWTQAVSAALYARERTGAGQHIRLSLLDAAISFMWHDAMMHRTVLDPDVDQQPNILDDYQLSPCADGHVAVMPLTDGHWKGIAAGFERPELLDDPRFASPALRADNFGEMVAEISESVRSLPRDEVVALMVEHDVPVAPALRPDELADDPQVRHNDILQDVVHPVVGPIRRQRSAPRFAEPATELRPAPLRGADNAEVLSALGYDEESIARLTERGIVG